jgi:hypothetical protein
MDCPQRQRGSSASPGQKAGIRYQTKVLAKLTLEGSAFTPSPWFCYIDSGLKPKWCQPDFLLELEGAQRQREQGLIIGEIKKTFHPDAWLQLEKIYKPVIHAALPGRELISLCICRSFDPAIPLPIIPNLISNIHECAPGAFNVMVERI